jgi:integrase
VAPATAEAVDQEGDADGYWRRRSCGGFGSTISDTFASLLLQNGESIVYVKEQLGHASIQITVDTYGHPIAGANRAAVDKLDDVPAQPAATGGGVSGSAQTS